MSNNIFTMSDNGYLITGTYLNGIITGYYYDSQGIQQGCVTLDPASINIYGCTNPIACNYNPSATIDNGSCLYINNPSVNMVGTWDWYWDNNCNGGVDNVYPLSFLSNGTFFFNNSSTMHSWSMCGDSLIFDWNSNGSMFYSFNYSNGILSGSSGSSCYYLSPSGVATAYGCMDSTACNYDSSATIDNGSCVYVSNPVVDMTIVNWEIVYDGNCAGNRYSYPNQQFNSTGASNIGTTSGSWNGWSWTMCDSTLTMTSNTTGYQIIGNYINGVINGYYYEYFTCQIIYDLTVPFFNIVN